MPGIKSIQLENITITFLQFGNFKIDAFIFSPKS